MTNTVLLDQIVARMPAELRRDGNASEQEVGAAISHWLTETSEESASDVLFTALQLGSEDRARNIQTVHTVLVGIIRRMHSKAPFEVTEKMLANFRNVYPDSATNPGFQSLLLRCLVAANTPATLQAFADLLVTNRVPDSRFCLEIFGDLVKRNDIHSEALFPKLLDGLTDPQLAGFALDYANHVYRNGSMDSHPAKARVGELIAILSTLAERLGKLQDSRPESDEEATQLGKQVTDAVSLGIPLCDALACIGDPAAIACLNKALQVEHRRLRVEAAAALAKLEVEDAKMLLAAMASEPVERLRVLNYATELGILDSVDEEFSNIVARAEAEFVTYLSQPTHFGVAPQHVELIDQREMAWPGYEEPRNCYLFQFVYRFEMGDFTNIGIAGPLVKAIQPDLTHLSQEDIYAIFAGWHVEHPDILAIDADRTVGQDQIFLGRMLESLRSSEDYEDAVPVLLGKLLDQNALIASVERNDVSGWAIVAEDSISWLPIGSPQSPLGAEDIFHLYVGRSLLRSFN